MECNLWIVSPIAWMLIVIVQYLFLQYVFLLISLILLWTAHQLLEPWTSLLILINIDLNFLITGRFLPHIIEKIFCALDLESLTNAVAASSTWNEIILDCNIWPKMHKKLELKTVINFISRYLTRSSYFYLRMKKTYNGEELAELFKDQPFGLAQ